jgi:iron uptake system component EfeO
MKSSLLLDSLLASTLLFAACGDDDAPKTDEEYAAEVVAGFRTGLAGDLDSMAAGAAELCAAAPTPADRGWDVELDADAIADMQAAWVKTRVGYERTEGALAPLFPELDFSIDARYDDFLGELHGEGDPNPFDAEGATGMHAIERILYVGETPPAVVEFETTLPGYKAAAFPATAEDAATFKTGICAKLVADAEELRDQWADADTYDLGAAYQGLIGLMNEQKEKVNKASTSEEESRYSQRTMADLRDNLVGAKKAYLLFQGWILSKDGGVDVDAKILAGFAELDALYGAVEGDAIPQPPATWSSENPSAEDLASPFGKLYIGVRTAVDPATDGSVVDQMNKAATLMGFPPFEE